MSMTVDRVTTERTILTPQGDSAAADPAAGPTQNRGSVAEHFSQSVGAALEAVKTKAEREIDAKLTAAMAAGLQLTRLNSLLRGGAVAALVEHFAGEGPAKVAPAGLVRRKAVYRAYGLPLDASRGLYATELGLVVVRSYERRATFARPEELQGTSVAALEQSLREFLERARSGLRFERGLALTLPTPVPPASTAAEGEASTLANEAREAVDAGRAVRRADLEQLLALDSAARAIVALGGVPLPLAEKKAHEQISAIWLDAPRERNQYYSDYSGAVYLTPRGVMVYDRIKQRARRPVAADVANIDVAQLHQKLSEITTRGPQGAVLITAQQVQCEPAPSAQADTAPASEAVPATARAAIQAVQTEQARREGIHSELVAIGRSVGVRQLLAKVTGGKAPAPRVSWSWRGRATTPQAWALPLPTAPAGRQGQTLYLSEAGLFVYDASRECVRPATPFDCASIDMSSIRQSLDALVGDLREGRAIRAYPVSAEPSAAARAS